MKILIIGGGGREHALAWKLVQSDPAVQLIASPGNPGIEQLGQCFPAPSTIMGYCDLAESQGADLTVVGPEAPLVAGVVDLFRERSLPIVGPTQAAAQIEGSKLFAKALFARAAIPTARRISSLAESTFPLVIKADGLAAGKGVVIATDRQEAEHAIARFGNNVLLEEFLAGDEVSFICLTDGRNAIPFPPSQDHKRAYDGDLGPNTGGMGAYSDKKILSGTEIGQILDTVIYPILDRLQRDGTPFTGFLYAGLMMTAEGPKVLEFNARLGDPETQALMMSIGGNMADLLERAARSDLKHACVEFVRPAACIVMAGQGYPEQPEVGQPISGLDRLPAGVVAFQAGTARQGERTVTAGGRVLGITAAGDTLRAALDRAYAGVHQVQFDGMQFRTDIGQKGLRRAEIVRAKGDVHSRSD